MPVLKKDQLTLAVLRLPGSLSCPALDYSREMFNTLATTRPEIPWSRLGFVTCGVCARDGARSALLISGQQKKESTQINVCDDCLGFTVRVVSGARHWKALQRIVKKIYVFERDVSDAESKRKAQGVKKQTSYVRAKCPRNASAQIYGRDSGRVEVG